MTPSSPLIPRRTVLRRAANGFGWLAFSALGAGKSQAAHPLALRQPHFPARAKRVIFLFMDGGPSQVDTFDPKPRLRAEHGRPFAMKADATQFDSRGTTFGSPFDFSRHGKSGLEISSIFPHLGRVADELCVVRSMTSQFPEHSQACYFIHTGHALQGRPSLGSWASYGLGSECDELPGYVVLNGGMIPLGGVANYSSAFLPAVHEGSLFQVEGKGQVIENVRLADATAAAQAHKLQFLRQADVRFAAGLGPDGDLIESAIANYETAAAMQTAVPAVTDLKDESAATLKLYGVDSADPHKARYARQCLLARRLVERGVRFVELTCVSGLRFVSPWDDHENLARGHQRNAEVVDQPVAALLTDLRQRGLLEDTLVVWAGEFGRTPFAQGSKGRDHNPQGFSVWMAGGGVQGGMTYGATDEYGYRAVENVVTMHDLHATLLHLLGFDHEKLTVLHGGRYMRLTDVHGTVIRDLFS